MGNVGCASHIPPVRAICGRSSALLGLSNLVAFCDRIPQTCTLSGGGFWSPSKGTGGVRRYPVVNQGRRDLL